MTRWVWAQACAVSAVAALLTACSGGGGSAPSATPTVSPVCDIAHVYQGNGILLSPARGATNVPASVGSITVAYDAALVGVPVTLQANGTSTYVAGGAFAPSGGGTSLSASIPGLAAGTTYFVIATVTATGSCPFITSYTFGTFTTASSSGPGVGVSG